MLPVTESATIYNISKIEVVIAQVTSSYSFDTWFLLYSFLKTLHKQILYIHRKQPEHFLFM